MIKNCIAFIAVILVISCSKKSSENNFDNENYVEISYDTLAVDSFSAGAISVDVAAKIRRSSVAYQDSLRRAKVAADIARKELDDKKKAENLEKEKKAAEKKKEVEKAAEKKEVL